MRKLILYGTATIMLVTLTACFSAPSLPSLPKPPSLTSTVDRVKGVVGKPELMGPDAPSPATSFADGKQAAKADFNRTVSWATGIALWILIPLSILVLIASFFVAWIPTRASIWCAVAAVCVAGGRYALLVYGVFVVDIAVYISIGCAILVGTFVGLPLVFSWVNRRIHKQGEAMADPGQAAAVLATVNPDIAKNQSGAAGLIQIARSGVDDIANKARAELKKIGVSINS